MKKFLYKFLVVALAFGMLTPTWLGKMWAPAKAEAANSATGGGSSVVNGSGNFVMLDSFTVTSNNAGDIDSTDDVKITVSSTTAADLEFDTSKPIIADPSSGLDLGAGEGNSVLVTPAASEIIISVTTISAPAGSYLTIAGISLHSTHSGSTSSYKGKERIKAVTNGGTVYGLYFDVDAQYPKVSASKITVTGNTGLGGEFKVGDSVNVEWDNAVIGDNNNDIALVGIDFSEFGGSVVDATNIADIWEASYILPADLNLNLVKAKVGAIDWAGNVSIIDDDSSFDVDTQSPTITIDRIPNADLSATHYQLSINFGDASTDKQYRINSGSWEVYVGAFLISTDGSYTVDALGTDTAGNVGNTSTSFIIDSSQLPAPINLAAIAGDGEVSLFWDAVINATSYEVSYKKSSDSIYSAPISISNTTTKIAGLVNGISYDFQIAAIGSNNIKSISAITTATPIASTVILTSTTKSGTAPAVTTVVTAEPAQSQIQADTQATAEPEVGQIKGEEQKTTDEEKINWTPWIILFILIILAGAATGGYFYWFGRDEEEELISREVLAKSEKAKKDSSKSASAKKNSKRW